jgi:hypothetical protein
MKPLKTIKVQGGKEYVEVHTRVNYFRSAEEYKGWGENCDIIEKDRQVYTNESNHNKSRWTCCCNWTCI